MCYWIELRCAKMRSGKCYSVRQVDTPMQLTRNATSAAINFTVLQLTKEALALKWRCTDGGWICPECQ